MKNKFNMMIDKEFKVEFKIGNNFVSVDEVKVFIEKVELDKEFVRVVTD